MTNKSWKKIWNKNAKQIKPKNLDDLLKLNGHSSATSEINRNEWKKYTNYFIKKYDIQQNQYILEIGCGCGAFLYFFYKKKIKCYGIDNSKELIKIAKKFFNKENFFVREANSLKQIKNRKFDFIFVNPVFQYFINLKYAKQVLDEIMRISHSNTKIIILDVPDIKKYSLWQKSAIKKIGLTGFKKNYKNLKHKFYEKKFFYNYAYSNKLNISISNQTLIKKENSKFRFNIFLNYEKK
jgi:ubiquinone/menaquinone biosynthesis C-methylase UbiE